MSVRASRAAVAAVVVTLFVVGRAQTSSPNSPSASASSSVSGSTSLVQSTSTFAPLRAQFPCSEQSSNTVLLAQLKVVNNFLDSANHQLNLFLFPPNGSVERYESLPVEENTLDLYDRATAALDCVAPNYPPTSFAPGTDALTLIIEQATITLDLLVKLPPSPPPPPSIPQIIKEAEHIISVATALMNCTKDPCWPPVQ